MPQIPIKNKDYQVEVQSLCGNGNGVARIDGFVVFIPGSAAGDVLDIKIIKVTKSYAVGKINSVIKASPDRCEKDCEYGKSCGGCCFRHITYEAESKLKRAMIDDCFSHIAKLPIRTENYYPAKDPDGYRNKAIYPVSQDKNGRLVAGFYAALSHRIVEHDTCLIGPKVFSEIKDLCLALFGKMKTTAYDEEDRTGVLRSIYLRISSDGKILLTLILNADGMGRENEAAFCRSVTEKFPEIVGIVVNVNKKAGNAVLGDKYRTLWGDMCLTDTLCGKKFRISPAAFYQVNHAQAELLYNIAHEFADIRENDVVFDLYCGTGTIGITACRGKGEKLVGVEISPEATENARENAALNGICAEFICLDADEALDSPRIKEKKPDVIFIDPPRKGCGDSAVGKIASFGAKRIVYISCDPHTLARDLVKFSECGYTAEKAVGVDLFPRTAHVETVVLMSSVNK